MNTVAETLKQQVVTNAQTKQALERSLVRTNKAISEGLDVDVAPSRIMALIEYHAGIQTGLMIAIESLEDDNTCSQCESKSDFPLSDMGLCAGCFDAQEEEDSLQEAVNA